ncbi:MAG: TRAP transporter large permease, partial [Deltaproteobacteria bacterium]|nr:TRAP transporter large permease [Deltaproteobacteria bacterium]
MSVELIGVIGIALLFLLLCMRMYIGIVMALIGFLGFGLLTDFETAVSLFGVVPYSTAHAYTFTVLPLFVLMGQFAFHSGISADIYRTVDSWFGQLPGGLAMATIVGCAFFGAICGSSLATAATMGAVALPEMKKFKYDLGLASGSVAAGGTLGILIPPSIGFVIYGILIEESIGKLFMAGILPGILLTLFYMATVYITCKINPEKGPCGEKTTLREKILSLKGTWGMLILFVLVMGGIYGGIFTPTEAGGIGAFGAFLIALFRGRMNFKALIICLRDSIQTTAMIFLILIGANIFNVFMSVSQLPMHLADYIQTLELNRFVVLSGILFLYIVLGCIMDGFAMIILTIPILFPILTSMG